MNIRNEAISSFCRLRRLQEATDSGYVTCITCGKVVKWDECDGGTWSLDDIEGLRLNLITSGHSV